MQMVTGLVLLFTCLKSAAEAQDRTEPMTLQCNQTSFPRSGENVIIDCVLNSSKHHIKCKYHKHGPSCSRSNSQTSVPCKLVNISIQSERVEQLHVNLYNVTKGHYTITFEHTTCGEPVKDNFYINVVNTSTEAVGAPPPAPSEPEENSHSTLIGVCVTLGLVAIIAAVILGIRKRRTRPYEPTPPA